jgi:hypothetical protein
MSKKATLKRLSEIRPMTSLSQSVGRIGPDVTERLSPFAEQVLDEAKQCFSSEDQALSFLVENIVDKLGEASEDRSQMQEFLKLLLESDPLLREEILAGISVIK